MRYQYNAEGIRTSKAVGGQKTEFLLDGVNVIGEVSNGSGVTTYLRGVTGLISQKKPDNSKLYYMTNGHGDVTALVNSAGAITKSYTYDAFGVEQNIDPADTNPFRYCGEYFDNETQSIYLRARYYNPGIGRFTQQDPAMADGMNWYVYCSSNPINNWDPTGLRDVELRKAVEDAGGTVEWDPNTGKATITYNGQTATYYAGDGLGTYIDNVYNKMYVDSLSIENILKRPSWPGSYYYDKVTDDFGKFILRTWIDGDGSKVEVSSTRWTEFIMGNRYVNDRLNWLCADAVASGEMSFFNVSNTNLSGTKGDYTSGVGLLNGANMDVGGLRLYAQMTPIGDGLYSVSVTFSFNDIVDPNDQYFTDSLMSGLANGIGKGKDYQIKIYGTRTFKYSTTEGVLMYE